MAVLITIFCEIRNFQYLELPHLYAGRKMMLAGLNKYFLLQDFTL